MTFIADAGLTLLVRKVDEVWANWRHSLTAKQLERVRLDDIPARIEQRLLELPEFRSTSGGLAQGMEAFLRSPAFDSLVRQLFAIAIVDGVGRLPGAAATTFESGIKLYLPQSIANSGDEAAPRLLRLITAAVAVCAEALYDKGNPPQIPEDIRRDLESAVLRIQVDSIKRSIESLRKHAHGEVLERLPSLTASYRSQCARRYSLIATPNWNASERVALDSVYVAPRFRRGDTLEAAGQRTVVLGSPGAGKTTLATKLVRDLADMRATLAGFERVPFMVVLREYDAATESIELSIAEFIADQLSSSYQIDMPRPVVEYLLLQGSACVVFDGLDELMRIDRRREMTERVESFSALYPNVPVIVTSRRVGYLDAQLDADTFSILEIEDFSDEDVKQYVSKWFTIHADELSRPSDDRAQAFLDTSEHIDDLRRSPLMLALLCNLYQATGFRPLPTTRAVVYERCALVRYERWDKDRDIDDVDFQGDFLPVLAHIAGIIYENPSLQDGIGEQLLTDLASRHLCRRRYDREEPARAHAFRLIEKCVGRLWVFTDVGISATGERLFQFTHRTFLEYFAAYGIAWNVPTPHLRALRLLELVQQAQASLVPILAIQIEARRGDGSVDATFVEMLEHVEADSSKHHGSLLDFLVDCAHAATLGASVLRRLVQECFKLGRMDGAPTPVIRLLGVQESNLETVLDEVGQQFAKKPNWGAWRGGPRRELEAAIASVEARRRQ